MNNHKYFKVNEEVNRLGETVYTVCCTDNRINVFFGIWTTYNKKNKNLEEAIEQIEFLYENGVKSEKKVYETNIKILDKNKHI